MIFIYKAEASRPATKSPSRLPNSQTTEDRNQSLEGQPLFSCGSFFLKKNKPHNLTSHNFFLLQQITGIRSQKLGLDDFFFDVVSQLSEGFLTLGFSPSIHNHQESSRSSGTPHSSSGPHNTNRITHPKPITIFLSIDSTVRWMEVISYDMVWHDFLTLDYDVFFSLPYKKPHYT